jgi:hypothetical protein
MIFLVFVSILVRPWSNLCGETYPQLSQTRHEHTAERPRSDLPPGSEIFVANFHRKYPNKPGPPSSFKAELDHQMIGSAVAVSVMKVGMPTAAVLELEHTVLDGTIRPLTYVVIASAE